MEAPILSLSGLSKFYTSGQNVVVGLNNVNLSFSRGEFVAITGESGSGKSTLAQVVGGIFSYESGEMYFCGCPTSHYDSGDWERYRRDSVSFISQSYGILLSCTVLENVVSALRLSGMEKKQAYAQAKTILEKVELWELRGRRAAKLSSGQKQRLSIARALAKPAPILIADEPTGNLDPENSAKIIALLAAAATDRLVILITHDFQEAQNYATRKIRLQDGRVTMDAPLRSVAAPVEQPAKAAPKKQSALSVYISRLQLAGRPVWGSFVLLFFALTAFAVFAFLGTFIVALDDTPTRLYDDSAFLNGDPNRIVVQRMDGEPMTQEDYNKLLQVSHVKDLEKHGFLEDINYYYIPEQHYRSAFTLVNVGSPTDPVYEQMEEIEFLEDSHFAQTVPQLSKNQKFLTAGRLPESMEEVVVCGREEQIGKTFKLYLQDRKKWSRSSYICLEVTVVGVTDYGSGVYLHEQVGQMFNRNVVAGAVFMPNETLQDNQIQLSSGYEAFYELNQVIKIGEKALTVSGFHKQHCAPLMLVSPNNFQEFVAGVEGLQAGLTISNYAYTRRVLKAVQNMGYVAVSPYQMGATVQVQELVTERIQTLVICASVLVAVLALQVIVLRALFGSEMENYRLLANIGLTCATAKRSVLWQVLLFAALGQGVGFAALWQCNRMGVERIVSILRYLPPALMALLSAVHLLGALLAAAWICAALRKRVYPLLVNKEDLKLDEEVAQ